MALKFLDRAMVKTATTGTGTITLGAAISGYQLFAAAGLADGDTVHYTIVDDGVGGAWEIGLGTYTAAGTTLARTLIASSSGGLLSLSGNARVFVSALASDFTKTAGNFARRNGGLEVWQGGAGGAASFAVPAASTQYTADGWYLFTNTNQAYTVSQQAGLTNGSQWCAKVQRNAGQTGVLTQVFSYPLDTDELYPLLGQVVRLRFTAKAGANWSAGSGTLGVLLYTGTGTPVKQILGGYAGLLSPISTAVVLTATATLFQVSSAAAIATNARQAEVQFYWTPVGTAGADDSFSIDDLDVRFITDQNEISPPYDRPSFGEQLELCKRHFRKSFVYGTAPAQNVGANTGELEGITGKTTTGALWLPTRFDEPMRGAPSMTLFNPAAANAQARDKTAAADCSSTTTANVTAEGFTVSAAGNAGSAVGNLVGVHYTADSRI